MAKVKLYNSAGEARGDVELKDAVFSVAAKPSVVHQVFVALSANARRPWADTKNRGEVSGGGRKPWRQKGTGRARHGSIRSPLWKGGGVTFGPLSARNYKQKINKKVNRLAVLMCLSDKVLNGKLLVVEDFAATGKTKQLVDLRKALPCGGRTTLWLLPGTDAKTKQALRGIAEVDAKQAKDVNAVDLLNHQYVVMTKKCIGILERRFVK